MAKEATKIYEGDSLDYVSPGTIAVGDVVDLITRIGVAWDNAIVDDTIAVGLVGVFEIEAATADVIVVGDALYFDTTNRVLTTVNTHVPAGMAATAKAAAAAGSVYVRIG